MAKALSKSVILEQDHTEEVFKALREVTSLQVLVGIPSDTAERSDDEINNATIGYLMEFGSPAANIPARAWLVPGVDKVRKQALSHVEAAAQAALDGNRDKMQQHLHAAGNIGAEGAKNEMQTGNFVPLKPATIRNRHRQRGDVTMRQSEKDYMKFYYQLRGKGADSAQAAAAAQEEVGIRPLLNTLELLHSVTYVVRSDLERYA